MKKFPLILAALIVAVVAFFALRQPPRTPLASTEVPAVTAPDATASPSSPASAIPQQPLDATVAPAPAVEKGGAFPDWIEKWKNADPAERATMKQEGASERPAWFDAQYGRVSASGKFIPPGGVQGNAGERPVDPAELFKQANSMVRQQDDGTVRIGAVTIDPKKRTITIPARINAYEGLIEYALVTESGKVHEALFTTSAKPEEIHVASLLLGPPAKDGEKGASANEVKVSVEWDTNGPMAEHEIAHLVVTADQPSESNNGKPLPAGTWSYTGSILDAAGFAASREGSVIALISDPAALVINPREDAQRDDHHYPNKKLLPAKDTPIRIVVTIPRVSQ